jgi:hypothetical protein
VFDEFEVDTVRGDLLNRHVVLVASLEDRRREFRV